MIDIDDLATVRPLVLSGQGGGEVATSARVPDEVIARWEAAYRDYLRVGVLRAETRRERLELAGVLRAVAEGWREIAATPGLEWWVLAALSAAAETAEQQAREFSSPRPWARESHGRHGGDR